MSVLKRAACLLAAIAAAALFALACAVNGAGHTALSLALAGAFLAACLYPRRCRLSERAALGLALGAALALRLAALVCFPVAMTPVHDFTSYYRLAQSFAEGGAYVESSCAYFPHMLFFSLALSLPFRLFGTGVLTYQLCNLALSLAALALVYAILRENAGKRPAFLGALLWALEPVLTLYAPLNCHEHLVLALTLLYVFLLLRAARREENTPARRAAQGGALGLCLLALELVRPVGTLLLLATLLWLLPRVTRGAGKKSLAALGLAVLVFAGAFFGGKKLAFAAADGLRHEPLATASYGFTMLAGSNADSGGTWNSEDSRTFLAAMRADGGADGYRAANSAVLREARARWSGRSLHENLVFLAKKNATLWGGQKSVLNYLRMYAADPAAFDAHPRRNALLSLSCDAFLSALLLLSAAAFLRAALRREPDGGLALFCALAFLGYVCMYSLTEAAGRYSVSALPFLLLAAAGQTFHLKRGRTRE